MQSENKEVEGYGMILDAVAQYWEATNTLQYGLYINVATMSSITSSSFRDSLWCCTNHS